MAINKIIQVEAVPELPAYHGLDLKSKQAPFALGVSPAAEAISEPQSVEKTNEEQGQEYIEDFVNTNLARLKWYIYELNIQAELPDQNGNVKVKIGAALVLDQPVEDIPGPAADKKLKTELLSWIEVRGSVIDAKKQPSFYAANRQPGSEVEAGGATVGDILRATMNWDAPVPQKLGLSRLVNLEIPVTEVFCDPPTNTISHFNYPRRIVLPFVKEPPRNITEEKITLLEPDPIQQPIVDDSEIELRLRVKADYLGDGEMDCLTNTLRRFPYTNKACEDIDIFGINKTTGFLKKRENTDEHYRLLKFVEANAATQCWAAPTLLDCVEQKKTSNNAFTPSAASLCWLAAAGTVAILDPLLLALSMPEQGEKANFKYKSEGNLLAPLITRLLAALDTYNEQETTKPPLEYSDHEIRTALIQSAQELSLLTPESTKKDAIEQAMYFLGLSDEGEEHKELVARLKAFIAGEKPKLTNDRFASVLSSLESLISDMHTEGGVEAILHRVVEKIQEKFLLKLPKPAGQEAEVVKIINEGFASYNQFVDGDFDAHDAMRKSVGFLTFKRVAGSNLPGSLSVITQKVGGNKLSDDHGMDVFNARLFRDYISPNPLDKLYAGLWRPDANDRLKDKLRSELTTRSSALSKEWVKVSSPAQEPYQLMVPDSSPAPLPMQIGDDADSAEAELFEELFSGVGMLIRRDDQKDWRHANLVKLIHNPDFPGFECNDKPPHTDIDSVACRALQPSRVDDRLSLFMPYDGFPLSTPAFDQTQLEQEEPSYEEMVLRKPFYETEDVIDAQEWAKVPQLAYGRAFDILAYLRTEGGALPKAVRDSSYWLPGKPGFHEQLPKDADVERFIYRRRTAIGKLGVEESSEYTASRELHKDITFYSEDFPRQSLVAEKDNPAVLDLIRNTDGTGGLLVRKDDPVRLRLDEVCAWGASTLQVDVFHLDIPKGKALERVADQPWPYGKVDGRDVHATVKFAGGEDLLPVEISVSPNSLDINCVKFDFESELGEETQVWVRLTLTADGDRAALSFGDTNREDGFKHFYAKPQPAPKILLRPADNATKWLYGFKPETKLTLKYPRVGYLDLERWCANSELVSPFEHGEGDDNGALPNALLEAYLLRGLDTVETDEDGQRIKTISRMLDELPDPAVHSVLIRLAPDISMQTDVKTNRDVTTNIQNELHCVLKIPKLNRPDNPTNEPIGREQPDNPPEDPLKTYRDYLSSVDDTLTLKDKVTVITADQKTLSLTCDDQSVIATIPEGMIARLSFEIMVDSGHFDEVKEDKEKEVAAKYAPIDPGIGAHANARYNFGGKEYHLFRGEEFIIEVMTNSLPLRVDCNRLDGEERRKCEAKRKEEKLKEKAIRDLALKHVVADTSGRDRAYSLRQTTLPIDAQNVRLWRNLSKLTIYTQQWRYMGRPIYNLPSKLKPKSEGVFNTDPSDPVVELDIDGDLVLQMEREAYFGRPDHDAIFIDRKIQPLPLHYESEQAEDEYSTVLERFSWEPDSATLFRHRFECWSRYAAAMNLGEIKSVRSWDEDSKTVSDMHQEYEHVEETHTNTDDTTRNNWSIRLAVKALIRDTELTRPQVKALIPLTHSANSPTETPPILCVLQEAPYQSAGLAERLLGGIAAGIHYGLEPIEGKPNEKALRVCDVRKEIGPKPRLNLDRLDEGDTLGSTINNEGPVGLTFDRSSTSTPAWTNSEIIFSPLLTSDRLLDSEHRLGVTVRRILDPGWCYSPAGSRGSSKNGETNKTYSASRTWYIEYDPLKIQGLQPALSIELGENNNLDIIYFEVTVDAFVDATMNDLCLDEMSGNGEFKKICRTSSASIQKIILLHQAVGNKRYRITVLADTHTAPSEDAIGKGQSNFPKVLVSTEWTVPESQLSSLTNAPMLLIGGASAVRPSGASAPTDIYWVETSRNSESIYVHDAENPVPIQTRHENASTDSVRSVITADSWLKFKKGEDDCYVKSKVLPNYMPVSEHRHLAAWLFKQNQTIGQPVEEYLDGFMLHGSSAKIPPDMISAKDDFTVRLFEFHTPAQPVYLGGGDTATDDELSKRVSTYKVAYFDIHGSYNANSNYNGEDKPPTKMDFRLRIVRGDNPDNMRFLSRLELIMNASTDVYDDVRQTINITFTEDDSPKKIDYFLISLEKSDEVTYEYEVRAIYVDGIKIISTGNLVFPAQYYEGLFIRANAYNSSDESIPGTWCDISLLSSKDRARDFDFDWIIPALNDVERKKAITPDELNKLKECQAGYVSLSAPIMCIKEK